MIKVFCACFLIIPLCISAEGWVVTVVDSSGGPFVSLAVDSASQPRIAYSAPLKYARYDSSGWVIETVDTGGISYVSLSLHRSGIPHIGYYAGNGNLRHARKDSVEWFIEMVDTAGNVGKYVSIDMTSTDCPGISYYDETSRDLKYAEWDGDHWLVEKVDTAGDVGRYTSLAFDKDDSPHISYYDATNYCLRYARKDGNEWFVAVVDTPSHTYERVGWHTSLALDTLGYPHISYHYCEQNGIWPNGLRYAEWDGSEWLLQLVDWGSGDNLVGVGTSMVIDSKNCARIAYVWLCSVVPGRINYAAQNGIKWGIEVVDSFPHPEGEVSLSLDIPDHPHIVYCTMDWALKHATRPTSVEEDRAFSIPGKAALQQNYPNPFSENTNICFWMSDGSVANPSPNLEIYDGRGRLVRNFQVHSYLTGLNLIRWDGRNGLGRKVADGVYFYRLRTGEVDLTRKMVILR